MTKAALSSALPEEKKNLDDVVKLLKEAGFGFEELQKAGKAGENFKSDASEAVAVEQEGDKSR